MFNNLPTIRFNHSLSLRKGMGLLLLGLVCLFNSGCGYMMGGAHSADVRTVAVPTFGNDTFRRGLEFQLTEAIQSEIKLRTPYKIAKEPNADTRLTGKIIQLSKRSLNASAFNDVRQVELSLAVQVTWEDIRTGQILAQEQVPLDPQAVKLLTDTGFTPEVGHSLATATQRATQQMARQIVDMMEAPW